MNDNILLLLLALLASIKPSQTLYALWRHHRQEKLAQREETQAQPPNAATGG